MWSANHLIEDIVMHRWQTPPLGMRPLDIVSGYLWLPHTSIESSLRSWRKDIRQPCAFSLTLQEPYTALIVLMEDATGPPQDGSFSR
jgi:hypothetical protein